MKIPKKHGLAAATVLVLLGIGLASSKVLVRKITVRWSYDYSRQSACSLGRVKDCIDHFEIQDLTDQENPKVLRIVANPENAVGKVDNISDTFSYGPPFGLRTIAVIAVAKDQNGNRTTSNPYAARKDVQIQPKTIWKIH